MFRVFIGEEEDAMKLYKWLLLLAIPATGLAQTTVPIPYNGSTTTTQTTTPGTVNITIPAGCVLTGTVVTCPTVPPPPPPPGNRTKLVPSGGNDQAIVDKAAAKGPIELGCSTSLLMKLARIVSASAGCKFLFSPSHLPSGTDAYFDDFVTVSDVSGENDNMFSLHNVNHVTLKASGGPNAALVTMPFSYAQGSINKNCIHILDSSDILIDGLRFDKCGEDSLYAGHGSVRVHWTNIKSTNPLRNGFSITDQVSGVEVDHSEFSGAVNLKGGIADGFDLEPNGPAQGTPIPGEFVKAVNIHDNYLHDNAGDGGCLCLWFTAPSTPLDYTFTNNRFDNNGKHGFNKDSWPSPMNSTLQSVKGSGNTVNGAAVVFP
jgi:hypothetical protein